MRRSLNRVALTGAAIALLLCAVSMLGYGLDRPALYHIHPGYQAMSPVTALGLGMLAGARIARVGQAARAVGVLSAMAVSTALAVMGAYLATGQEPISLWLASAIFGPRAMVGHTSPATALSILLLGLADALPLRRFPWLSDAAAAITLLIASLALLGYAYGVGDLYALPLFRSMAINTATAIFLLACASILTQAQGGWAEAIALEGTAGRTTRQQLLFTLIPPFVGFILVDEAAAGRLGLSAAMALFVILTLAPLIWLILRDGKTLAALEEERHERLVAERDHLANLEHRLADQATELRASNVQRLALAERNSLRSETRYRQLFDSIDAGFCVIELIFNAAGRPTDYVFVEVNAAFEANTGLRKAQGQRMRTLAPDHEQHWFDIYGRVVTTGDPVRFELPASALGDRWYDVHAFPVEDGTSDNRVGILFNDVSERKRAQIALEQINATLEQRIESALAEREQAQTALRQSQKMEAMGQLTGGVAHDFNNLLTPIIGSLDLIARRGANTEREMRLINGALQSADRAKTLVQRLLAFARRQPLQPGPVDVARLIHDMSDLAKSTLGSQIAVVTHVPDGLPAALADANQLEMALLNLAVNARDAMPDGGTLTIAAKQGAPTTVPACDLAAGGYIVLSVADTGNGMDEDTRIRATEPFFSTKGIGKGTGLGLSMVHGLAAQLGGALDIHSVPGLGTRVDLWLPAVAALPPALLLHDEAQPVAASHPARRALLVDDEEVVRMTTADMLQELGFSVIEVATAQDAVARLQQEAKGIDLLITDHLMPGMTGADLARKVRREWPSIPVLLISGYAESEGVAPDLPRLSKPFRQHDLADAITGLSHA